MYSIGKYKANLQLGYGPSKAARISRALGRSIGYGPSINMGSLSKLFSNAAGGFLGAAIGIVLVIFVVAALVGPVANFTTGITIAHSGFTPNPNVTQSPGAAPLLQIYPLFFAIFGLLAA